MYDAEQATIAEESPKVMTIDKTRSFWLKDFDPGFDFVILMSSLSI